ncbi:uncharacterized protein IL334_002775 [Kwoniella shivajii]|uniref:B2-aldehyde-forming enzyme n=1 Tax=Kwoniella shivajii TaxID=564305 RepID=A0ABZ1CXD0_9TREE|nr:hypothetical protein IL334_002775 [Kwoniella shivajii]
MVPLLSLFTLLLPLAVVSSSHLPPPHKRQAHDRARKNFEHVHANELEEREHHFDNRTIAERGDTFTGVGTYYFTGLGACGQYSSDSDFMVALNSAQYGSGYPGPQCFKGITVQANGKTVSGITILDECPTCAYGSLDLSPGLFTQFAGTDAGTVQITWWFNDGAAQTTTSQTPTSTYTPPTSTYTPPTSTSPTPSSTTQWSQPAVTSAYTSSSTITSSASAAFSTITSSVSNSVIAHNTTNPYVVVANNATTASITAGGSNSDSNDSSSSTTSSGTAEIDVNVVGNIEGLNGLVAQYGQLVVVAAEAA